MSPIFIANYVTWRRQILKVKEHRWMYYLYLCPLTDVACEVKWVVGISTKPCTIRYFHSHMRIVEQINIISKWFHVFIQDRGACKHKQYSHCFFTFFPDYQNLEQSTSSNSGTVILGVIPSRIGQHQTPLIWFQLFLTSTVYTLFFTQFHFIYTNRADRLCTASSLFMFSLVWGSQMVQAYSMSGLTNVW
jgi:hypothetical protein